MLKKIVNVFLIVIIPLLAAFAVGVYGYNRYNLAFTVKDESKGYYDTRIEENNTLSEIEAYLDFYNQYYRVVKFTSDGKLDYNATEGQDELDVKNADGKHLFTLRVYAIYNVDEDGTKKLNYAFYMYNVNYGNSYKEIYTTGSQQLGAYIPTFTAKFIDNNSETIGTDDELSTSDTFTVVNRVEIVDYNWVGYTTEEGKETYKNSNGEVLSFGDTIGTNTNRPNVKYATYAANKEYTENMKIEISVTDTQYASYDESTVIVATIEFNNVIQRPKYFDTESENVVEGYDEDIYEAGYFKYAFARYIWWESLIALVLTLIVTGATVIVWSVADESEKKKKLK